LSRSLRQGVMVEAYDARNLPDSIFVLPDVNELRLADIVIVSRMVETMHADFYRAIVGNGVNLKCSWNKFSGHFAANVVLDAIYNS